MAGPGRPPLALMPRRSGLCRLLPAVVLIPLLLAGCGVKGPPLAPRQPPLPGVVDAAYRLVDGKVALGWTLAGPLTSGQARDAVFVVYRSRSSLADPACATCPLIFDKVATLPYTDASDQRYSIDLPVETGYHYTFKVQLESGRAAAKEAATVAFDLPEDETTASTESP